MPKALLIIARQGYQDVELQGTRLALEQAGFSVSIGSKERGRCAGKFGGSEEAGIALREVKTDDFDRIAFIGGPGAQSLIHDEEAQGLARAMAASGKAYGAICIAPLILAAAGVLKAKRATVWDDGKGTQIRELEEGGAAYSGEDVTVDGLLVTGNGPKAAENFGKVLATFM